MVDHKTSVIRLNLTLGVTAVKVDEITIITGFDEIDPKTITTNW